MDTYSQAVAAYSTVVAEDQKLDLEEQITATLEAFSHPEHKEQAFLFYGQAICEVIFGLSLAWLISWLTPRSWSSLHLSFCAFFLVIFALAVRYPKQVVYVASLLAATTYALVLQAQSMGGTSLSSLSFLLEPFLLLLSGVLMVDIFHAQRQRLQEIEQKFARTTQELEQVTDHNKILMEQNILLEKQLVEDVVPITKICITLAQIWEKTGVDQYEAILNLVMQITEAQSCALYRRRNGSQMRRQASQSESGCKFPLLLDINDPVVHIAIQRCQPCTIRDVLGERDTVSPDAAVMAGPLLNGKQEIIGMVVIGSMPFSKFTANTFAFLGAVLEVVSASLEMPIPRSPLSIPLVMEQDAHGHDGDDETVFLASQSRRSKRTSRPLSKKII